MANLNDQVDRWGTPTARDWKDGSSDLTNVPENGLLGRMAANWSTPRATDGEKGGPNQSFGAGGIPLPAQAQNWPTPDASVMNDGEGPETFFARQAAVKAKGINGNGMGMPLTIAATTWPTPTSLSYGESHQPGNSRSYNKTMELASSLPDLPISTVGEESSHIRRSLNPLFVEWLMGWLRGWTLLALTPPASNACACSATELFHWKRRMRSALLQLGLPEDPPVQQRLFA